MQHFAGIRKSNIHRIALGFAVIATTAFASLAQESEPLPPPPVQPDEGNLRVFLELVRSDIQTEKATIIAQNIQFTDDEAFEFWPLHREYALELNKLLDQRLNLIRKHVTSFDSLSDRQAEQLAKDVFDLESKRLKLKRTWFKKFAKVIPAKKAAQFFQLESQLNAALDLRVAAALPLIK
ncbi:MAG: hypothetical protein RI897_1560 [Verrucomicrobiota bacterium]|jgi:hypothetical protein